MSKTSSDTHEMRDEDLVRLAARVAVTCNGGVWEIDYTSDQRELWIVRVSEMLLKQHP